MDAIATHKVTLPNGEVVSVSQTEQSWWQEHDGVGYVHPSLLAPDPDQPRKAMNPSKLQELHGSIATTGVREPITVTPRCLAPWAHIEKVYDHTFFIIVSGHRRWNGAMLASLEAVPIKIRVYPSTKEHHLDRSLLNAGRENLSPLEEGWELVALRNQGYKIDELAKMFGIALPQLYARMNLTKLHPDIQALLDPEVNEKKRLPTTTAGALGGVASPTFAELVELYEKHEPLCIGLDSPHDELSEDERRFLLQKILLRVIQVRSLNTTRAVEFIRDHVLKYKEHAGTHHGPKTERYQPRRRREVLENLVNEVRGTVVVDWPPTEFRRIYENASYEEIGEMIAKLSEASEFFAGLSNLLGRIQKDKKPTHPDVLRLLQKRG